MRPSILVLSGLYDFSCDLICSELTSHGINFVRINKEQVDQYKFAFDPIHQIISVNFDEICIEIDSSLNSVLFRQPVFLRNTPSLPLSSEEQLHRSQWSAFFRSLRVLDTAKWMNDPQITYLAESKPYQLFLANKFGLKIPKTVIGNDIDKIYESFDRELMIKSLDTILLKEKDDCLFTYSTIVNLSELNESNVRQIPFIAQELLNPKVDIRVTIIGEAIFSVKIMSQGEGINGDWRVVPKDKLEYIDIILPKTLEKNLLKMVKKLGLAFAAIDLVETAEGFYFIELNPTGEWGWLQSKKRNITRAIVEWLVK